MREVKVQSELKARLFWSKVIEIQLSKQPKRQKRELCQITDIFCTSFTSISELKEGKYTLAKLMRIFGLQHIRTCLAGPFGEVIFYFDE
ncbi:hypothetical protein ACTXT7_002126 [Hymenolepis weldensis]